MSPCGRAVDCIRSAYEANMRFFRDSTSLVRVVWYFVPSDTEAVPFAHQFGSRIYDRMPEMDLALGEQFDPHPWRGGQQPPGGAAGGLCGSLAQWQSGALLSDPSPVSWPGTDVPRCCNPPIQISAGGIGLSGPNPIPGPCHCSNGILMPARLSLFVDSGFTDPLNMFVGRTNWPLVYMRAPAPGMEDGYYTQLFGPREGLQFGKRYWLLYVTCGATLGLAGAPGQVLCNNLDFSDALVFTGGTVFQPTQSCFPALFAQTYYASWYYGGNATFTVIP